MRLPDLLVPLFLRGVSIYNPDRVIRYVSYYAAPYVYRCSEEVGFI